MATNFNRYAILPVINNSNYDAIATRMKDTHSFHDGLDSFDNVRSLMVKSVGAG